MCEGRQAKCSPDAGPGIPAPLSVSSPSSEPHWGHSSGAESSCPHRKQRSITPRMKKTQKVSPAKAAEIALAPSPATGGYPE